MAVQPAPSPLQGSIPPPHPGLTPNEMLRRAEAMRPALRERQVACEAIGRLPENTNQDFLDAGFYRILQPRRFGGYEFELVDFIRVMTEVSRGCPESGWVLALTAGHPAAFISGFLEEAQREAYGETGDCRAPGVAKPRGIAIPVPGGYRIKGMWDYCSGCDVATHFLGGMMALDPQTQKPRAYVYVLLDRKDFSIVDNWDVIGMQGTGSRRVVVEEMTLPSHRVLEVCDAELKVWFTQPGHSLYENLLYHGPLLTLLMCELVSVAVGAARGALDVYEQSLRERKSIIPPFTPFHESPDFQHLFGDMQGLIDAAEAISLQMASGYMELARRVRAEGMESTAEVQRRFIRVGQQALDLSGQAVDTIFRTSRTLAAKKTAMLGRYFRNMAVIRTHGFAQTHQTSTNAGRLRFGLPPLGPV